MMRSPALDAPRTPERAVRELESRAGPLPEVDLPFAPALPRNWTSPWGRILALCAGGRPSPEQVLECYAHHAGPHPHPRAYLTPEGAEVLYPEGSPQEAAARTRSGLARQTHPLIAALPLSGVRVRVIVPRRQPPIVAVSGLRLTTPALDPAAPAWAVTEDARPKRVLGWTPDLGALLLGAAIAYATGGAFEVLREEGTKPHPLAERLLDPRGRAEAVRSIPAARLWPGGPDERVGDLRGVRARFLHLLERPRTWLPALARTVAGGLPAKELRASASTPWGSPSFKGPLPSPIGGEHGLLARWLVRFAEEALFHKALVRGRAPGLRAVPPLGPLHPLHPGYALPAPRVEREDEAVPGVLALLAKRASRGVRSP